MEEPSRNSVIIKPKRCNTSIDELTNELLVEILQRVSCKSAFRFKSISKRWFALISDPYFTHSFVRYHTNEKLQPKEFVLNFYLNEFLITSQLPEVGFLLNLSFLPCFQTSQLQEEEAAKACVVGSSNGLLLCSSTVDYQSIYYVCNPLTKQWVVLPPALGSPKSVLVGFICDPVCYCNSSSSKCSTSSFKVVRLCTLQEGWCKLMVETFSSKTGHWINSVVPTPPSPRVGSVSSSSYNKTATEFNGRLHWHLLYGKVILVYHPNDDKVTFLDCPRHGSRLPHYEILGVSRGCLRMSSLLNFCLVIWELKDYNTGNWSLKHKININDLPHLLAFHPYADVMFLGFPGRFVSCDLPTKTFKFLSECPYEIPRRSCTLVLPPWPTPVPVPPLPHDALSTPAVSFQRSFGFSNWFTNIN